MESSKNSFLHNLSNDDDLIQQQFSQNSFAHLQSEDSFLAENPYLSKEFSGLSYAESAKDSLDELLKRMENEALQIYQLPERASSSLDGPIENITKRSSPKNDTVATNNERKSQVNIHDNPLKITSTETMASLMDFSPRKTTNQSTSGQISGHLSSRTSLYTTSGSRLKHVETNDSNLKSDIPIQSMTSFVKKPKFALSRWNTILPDSSSNLSEVQYISQLNSERSLTQPRMSEKSQPYSSSSIPSVKELSSGNQCNSQTPIEGLSTVNSKSSNIYRTNSLKKTFSSDSEKPRIKQLKKNHSKHYSPVSVLKKPAQSNFSINRNTISSSHPLIWASSILKGSSQQIPPQGKATFSNQHVTNPSSVLTKIFQNCGINPQIANENCLPIQVSYWDRSKKCTSKHQRNSILETPLIQEFSTKIEKLIEKCPSPPSHPKLKKNEISSENIFTKTSNIAPDQSQLNISKDEYKISHTIDQQKQNNVLAAELEALRNEIKSLTFQVQQKQQFPTDQFQQYLQNVETELESRIQNRRKLLAVSGISCQSRFPVSDIDMAQEFVNKRISLAKQLVNLIKHT